MEIVPAIIGKNIKEIEDRVTKVLGEVKWIQIDVMDGIFTPQKSWPYTEGAISDLAKIDAIRSDEQKIEIHLMVQDPEKVISEFVEYGADRIVFHYEATKNYSEIINFLENEEVEVAVSIMMSTPISAIDELIGEIDSVQFMSIDNIGSYGQPFNELVLDRIKDTKEKYPGLSISVDGGVSLENAKSLIDAGAEDLIIGSAIFGKDNPKSEILKFKELESTPVK
ncbi:MAG: ribulose-phosphate 3-epimerase [Parcubacteria group bacterium GW2011_GWF2_38_76]|nr:MAG: ribulose-phosphate 3-epimerase [Parcubacteria group bacterium GW2011_GWF2_38_76]HBM46056.1 hypothetical protein [Patescibacteria group bacterium]